jgi:hypothetical protein
VWVPSMLGSVHVPGMWSIRTCRVEGLEADSRILGHG